MKSIETTGKTIDEAIEHGLKELNCSRDEVEVEILEAPSRGLFGLIGTKAAKVKLNLRDKRSEAELFGFTVKQEKPAEKVLEKASDVVKKNDILADLKKDTEKNVYRNIDQKTDNEELPETVAMNFLNQVFQKIGVSVNTEIFKENDFIRLSFQGDDLGILIGRRGETLDSLQYLTNLVVSRKINQKNRIILDVEGYRKRREETLVNLAHRLSDKVKKTGHNIVLEPMNPHERRIIHTALQNDQKVRTFSEGEEPYRKVIITKKSR